MAVKRMRIVLVVPNFRWANWDEFTLWHYTPYNLCLLAAMVKDICDVSILDAYKADMSPAEFKKELKALKPDVVGITVLMDQYAPCGHIAARIAKSVNRRIRVIIGGVYATTNPDSCAKDSNIDYVVIGEGEYVLRGLILHLAGGSSLPVKGICYRRKGQIVNKGRSDFITNLDALPMPAYYFIDFEKYANSAHRKSVDSPRRYPYVRITTSRGCPVGCVFCQVEHIAGRHFRPRSPGKVLDEIAYLKKTYGIKSLIFDDDNLFTDKRRAKAIFQGMIDRCLVMPWVAISVAVFQLDRGLIRLMRTSGCEYINIAIESGAERVLKEIVKKPVDYDYAKKWWLLPEKMEYM
jgi:magnesium-protoporphyrin IX monomethyl ester (oxidative) cyclase